MCNGRRIAKPTFDSGIEDFLDLTDLLLDFSFNFFVLAFFLETLVADELAGFLFDGADHFFGGSLDFITSAGFHFFIGLEVMVVSKGLSDLSVVTSGLTVTIRGILDFISGFLDVLPRAFHGVAARKGHGTEQEGNDGENWNTGSFG